MHTHLPTGNTSDIADTYTSQHTQCMILYVVEFQFAKRTFCHDLKGCVSPHGFATDRNHETVNYELMLLSS